MSPRSKSANGSERNANARRAFEALYQTSRNARPGPSRRRPTGWEHFCERCGGELIDPNGRNDRLVCRACGTVSNQLVLNAFDPSKFGNAPRTARGGVGGRYVREIVNRKVRREEEVRGHIRSAFRKAKRQTDPPERLVSILFAISDARDYTPDETPDSVPKGTILEGKGGVSFRSVDSSAKTTNGPRRVWKPVGGKSVPHKLAGLNVGELIGVVEYVQGGTLEEMCAFVQAVTKKKVSDGHALVRKTLAKPGIDRVLRPLYRERTKRALERIHSFFPDLSRWDPEKTRWVRARARALVETDLVPVELALYGAAKVHDAMYGTATRNVPEAFPTADVEREFVRAYRATRYASELAGWNA